MWIMPQIALQKIIQMGLKDIKDNPDILEDIFQYMHDPDLENDYGEKYVGQIKTWFLQTKIPVIHAWSFNAERIPCVSIHLANESEDENKAAIGDFFGEGPEGNTNITPFNVQLDVGIHASKSSDQVLWLYYIVTYVLFKYKREAERMGLNLQTFTASDWDKRADQMVENIWVRWIRFRCSTNNFWDAERKTGPYDMKVEVEVESETDEITINDIISLE